MAVRNISKIGRSGNPKPIPIHHVVPPTSDADFKLTIETASETIDLSDLVVSGRWIDGVTSTIGDYEFKILDPDQTVYDKVSKFDEIVIYADYGEPVTRRFRGKIERKGYQDIYFVISGRSIAMIYVDFPITYNSNGAISKSTILKEIIAGRGSVGDSYYYEGNFPDIDISGIEDDESTADVNYFEIPFIEIITEICGEGYDFYLRHDYVAQYFIRGSRTNVLEAISETVNHIETLDNAEDTEETYTKIRLYGKDIEEIPLISTSESDTSATQGVEKILKLDNHSAITSEQLKDLVDYEFEKVKDSKRIGNFSSLFLPTLQPGEKLFVVIPREDVPPAHYEIRTFQHQIDITGEYDKFTNINIKRERLDVSKIIKRRTNFENKVTANVNPNSLDHSLIYNFSTNEGTFNNTQRNFISSGEGGDYVLTTISGNTGNWTSPNVVFTPDTISELEFRITGDSLAGIAPEGTKIEYSLDGGITFHTWSAEKVAVDSKGQLQIRVNLSSSETQVKAVGVLYSL